VRERWHVGRKRRSIIVCKTILQSEKAILEISSRKISKPHGQTSGDNESEDHEHEMVLRRYKLWPEVAGHPIVNPEH
jgi:hypothetical protein